jgi:hypothetical protein
VGLQDCVNDICPVRAWHEPVISTGSGMDAAIPANCSKTMTSPEYANLIRPLYELSTNLSSLEFTINS